LRPPPARLAIIALSVLVFAACHSHVRVAVPRGHPTQPAVSNNLQLQTGDHVRATLVDGNIITFVVGSVDSDALVERDGRRVLYRDIARLEKRQVSIVKTTPLVVLGALVVIPIIVLALGGDSGSSGGGQVKVICTELFDRGLLDARLYATDLQLSRLHISPTTVRGYHFWAIPYVGLMRRSRLATRLIRPLAVAWAQQVCFDYAPDRAGYRSTLLGKFLRQVGEPACWAIGLISQRGARTRREGAQSHRGSTAISSGDPQTGQTPQRPQRL